MSILKSIHSGLNAPFTVELALKMGYTIKGYDTESNGVWMIWNVPSRITEKITDATMKFSVGLNYLMSNQNGVFFYVMWHGRLSAIDKLYHLSMLEKYWTCESEELRDLYAVLATSVNPNNIDINKLKEKYNVNSK